MSKPGFILVVDDTRMMRTKMSAAAGALGHGCEAVDSGATALDVMKANPVDAALFDITMPDMDGFEVLAAMKADVRLKDIPVIVISALDDTESAVKAIELGAEDFLPKSFDPIIFRAGVNALLERKYVRDAEMDYLQQVEKLATAAQILKTGNYNPSKLGLSEIGKRQDALGDLARVFADVAQKVYERERRLRHTINTLRGGFGLVMLGVVWGLVVPLSRMASELGTHPLGMAFWVSFLGGVIGICLSACRGQLPRLNAIPWGYFIIYALLGAVISESLLFLIAGKVEATIISIIVVSDGFMVFGIAAAMKIEQPSLGRFAGILLGLCGVLLILYSKSTEASIHEMLWIIAALSIPLCYAVEGIIMASRRPQHIPAIPSVGIMQLIAAAILLPIALASGEMIYPSLQPGRLEMTILLITAASVTANLLFLQLVTSLGSVFASQSSYFTTAAGIGWSMLLLNETLTGWIWVALGFMAAGLLLVGAKKEPELELQPLADTGTATLKEQR